MNGGVLIERNIEHAEVIFYPITQVPSTIVNNIYTISDTKFKYKICHEHYNDNILDSHVVQLWYKTYFTGLNMM